MNKYNLKLILSIFSAIDNVKGHSKRAMEWIRTYSFVPSEVFAAAGIYERIHDRIEPTQPRDDLKYDWIGNAVDTNSTDYVGDEKRQPTDDEDAHYHA